MNLTWANFWTTNVSVTRNLPQMSASLTRGGPLMARGPGWTTQVSAGNRAASQTRLTATATAAQLQPTQITDKQAR